jgi:hypothetical protein
MGDVIKGLIELLKDSKRWAGAIFIGCAGFLCPVLTKPFGPKPVLDIHWSAAGLLFLTGGFFVTFVLQWLSLAARAATSEILRAIYNAQPLSDFEKSFHLFMAKKYGYDSFHLDNINESYISKLEALHLCEGLQKRGLIEFNPFSPYLVSLSRKGRAIAVEISVQFGQQHTVDED